MEQDKDILLLELISRPVLCVKDGIIIKMNRDAAQMQITPGSSIGDYLPETCNTYADFSGGQLSLTLTVASIPCPATVTRTEDFDVFILDQPADFDKLQAMALASQQLRIPLNNVMTVTDQLLSHKDLEEECALRNQAKQISKGLFQLLRVITNMADAQRYIAADSPRMSNVNVTEIFREVTEKAAVLAKEAGITLSFTGFTQPVIGLIEEECLERGIYNMVSNAVKFSPKGGTVEAKLTKTGNLISFSVQDQGGGIPPQIQGTLFTRYQRQPGIEDGRFGIGLGMTMIRSAANVHGGTVLIDHPQQDCTRVTLTIPLRQEDSGNVHSPVLRISDYAGGWDHALMELSETLPTDAYGK